MAANASHHYVPQFYFKLFNGGERLISVLLTKDGRIIPRASIKGQCARHKFYGTAEIEKDFSKLENLHSAALHSLVAVATTSDLTKWSQEHYPWLLQAIAFQRARTMLEVEKEFPAMSSMLLYLFKEYSERTQPPEKANEIVGSIDRGEGQGLRITIAILGHMGSFVSRANPDFCPTVLRLFDSVVTNTVNCYSRHII